MKGPPPADRVALAERLRPIVRSANEAGGMTWDAIAASIGTSKPTLLNFVQKGGVPYSRTLNAIAAWAEARERRPGRVAKLAIEEARAADTPARLALSTADTLLLALNRAVGTGEIDQGKALETARQMKAVSTPEGRAMVEEWIRRMTHRSSDEDTPAVVAARVSQD